MEGVFGPERLVRSRLLCDSRDLVFPPLLLVPVMAGTQVGSLTANGFASKGKRGGPATAMQVVRDVPGDENRSEEERGGGDETDWRART